MIKSPENIREAAHAGSWYSSNRKKISQEGV